MKASEQIKARIAELASFADPTEHGYKKALRWALELVEAQETETKRLMALLVNMLTSDAGFTREDWYRICELSGCEDARDYVEECVDDEMERRVAEAAGGESCPECHSPEHKLSCSRREGKGLRFTVRGDQ